MRTQHVFFSQYTQYVCVSPLDSCNILNRTSVGLDLHAEAEIELEHGKTYFITVTATNNAGLSTTSSSNGITVDISPPVIQGLTIISALTIDQNITNSNVSSGISAISTNQHKISASWDNIVDQESEIKRISICATTFEEDCDLLTWRDLSPDAEGAILNPQKSLESGTVYMLKLQIENRAGLTTIVNSTSVLVDTTPPVGGFVKVGGKEGLVFMQDDQVLVASWWGFRDTESGISEYKWKICFANTISICLAHFVGIGLKTSVVLSDIGVDHGKQYKFVVKAVNFAGLEVVSVSNSFIFDKTSPQTGKIFTGRQHLQEQYHQSSSTEIVIGWNGFQDKESGISLFEICIGTIPGLCDVSGLGNVGLATSTTARYLNLTHNEKYFATVRATNGAGQVSFASSNEIIVDLTPPIASKLRDGDDLDTNMTIHDMFVSINWDEFRDEESGILKYVVCAGTIMGACDLVSQTTVSHGLEAKLNVWPAISSGTVVYSTLWAYNNAGGVTKVHSDGVLMDNTPPSSGNVSILIYVMHIFQNLSTA